MQGKERKWLKVTKKAIAKHDTNPFNFLIRLLVTFNVFVPIDLTIKTMNLGGVRINELFVADESETIDDSNYYFLPSQLKTFANDISELFNFKNNGTRAQYETCLAHSFVLNSNPPGMMHRIMASLLRTIHDKPRFQSEGIWYQLKVR